MSSEGFARDGSIKMPAAIGTQAAQWRRRETLAETSRLMTERGVD